MITEAILENFPATKRILAAASASIERITGIKVVLQVKIQYVEEPKDNKLQLQELVSKEFNQPWFKIISSSRRRNLSEARQVYMYFAKHFLKQSLIDTGADLGFRDHSTVFNGLNRIQDLIDINDTVTKTIERIKAKLPYDN